MTAGTAENPKKTATYRVLQAVVIILSVLIVLAMMALVVGGVMKMSGHRESAPSYSASSLTSQLPPGARITSVQTNGNRVVIAVHTAEGDEVDIFDTDTGRPVARIRAAAPK